MSFGFQNIAEIKAAIAAILTRLLDHDKRLKQLEDERNGRRRKAD